MADRGCVVSNCNFNEFSKVDLPCVRLWRQGYIVNAERAYMPKEIVRQLLELPAPGKHSTLNSTEKTMKESTFYSTASFTTPSVNRSASGSRSSIFFGENAPLPRFSTIID